MNEEVSYLQFIYMLRDESRRNAFYDHEVQFKKYYIYFPFYKIDISKENFAKSIGYIVGLTQCDVDKAEKLRENQLESKTWLNFGDTLVEVKKGLLRLHLSYMGIDNLDKLDGEENSFLHYLIRQPVDMSDVLTKVLPDILQIIEAKETTTSDLNDMYSNENIYGETPIFAAVLSGEQSNVEQCLSKLREQDETFNITTLKTKNNENLLHYAILSGNQEVVKYIKRQSDYNVWYDETNDDGLSSTDYYFFINNKIANGKLQEYSADPINHSSGKLFVSKVAHRLAQLKSPALLRWFVEKHKININDCNRYDANDIDSGDTLLHTAALYGSLQTVQYLVYHGANVNKDNNTSVNITDGFGWLSPMIVATKFSEKIIHFAALSGETEKFNFIHDNYANRDSYDKEVLDLYKKCGGIISININNKYSRIYEKVNAIENCLKCNYFGTFDPDMSSEQLEIIKRMPDKRKQALIISLLFKSPERNGNFLNAFAHLPLMYLKLQLRDDFSGQCGFESKYFTNKSKKYIIHFLSTAVLDYYYSIIGFKSIDSNLIEDVHDSFDVGAATNCKRLFGYYMKKGAINEI